MDNSEFIFVCYTLANALVSLSSAANCCLEYQCSPFCLDKVNFCSVSKYHLSRSGCKICAVYTYDFDRRYSSDSLTRTEAKICQKYLSYSSKEERKYSVPSHGQFTVAVDRNFLTFLLTTNP
jgi:hypothetical protein